MANPATSSPTASHTTAAELEQRLQRAGIALTMGGEPTLVPIDPQGAEWSVAADGPTKLRVARALAAELHPTPAVAGLPQVRKGYGQTQQRGLHRYARLWQTLVLPRLGAATPPEPEHTQALQDALRAALSDLPDPQNDGMAERPVLWLKPGA